MSNDPSEPQARQSRSITIFRWLWREFGDPSLCFVSIYLGVLSTAQLPNAFMPTFLGVVVISPLVAMPIAIIVMGRGGYRRWQTSKRTPLGGRMACACSDGAIWWRCLSPSR